MSGDLLLSRWTRPARRRGMVDDLAVGVPLLAAPLALAWRIGGWTLATAMLAAGLVALAVAVRGRARQVDDGWTARQLDRRHAALEDSAGLLLADPAALGPLERLQRTRLEQRLAEADYDLRRGWSWRTIALAWTIGIAAAGAILLVHPADAPRALAPSREGLPALPGVPRLAGQRLRVVPPAYTGLPARDEALLDVRAPVGARLTWRLRFSPQPNAATLAFLDGRRVALRRSGDEWTAAATLDRSALYRVVPAGTRGPAPPLHRLDAVADRPPAIRVIAPRQGLTLTRPGQTQWALLFEATDDHAVAATARLRLTIAEGEGENIAFSERSQTLAGSGPPRARRFAVTLDLARLGFRQGGDLVAQLVATDTRVPGPQVARSASVILRWPGERAAQGTGVEGVLKGQLPAYLRSQRQIIIDAETLVRQRRRLAAAAFLARSEVIGADQAALRNRYGQYMGQETEGEAVDPRMPAEAPARLGSDLDVLAEFGQEHSEADPSSPYDPATHSTLGQALDAMFRSETELRQGAPEKALPHAYTALRFLKQAQQAQRIYLARVGSELPPIDESRRLTGKREDIGPAPLVLPGGPGDDARLAGIWRALGGADGARALPPLDAWLRLNPGRVTNRLGLAAAIDEVRRRPGCEPCRARVAGLVWALLARPPANVLRRPEGGAEGRRYLDALGGTR